MLFAMGGRIDRDGASLGEGVVLGEDIITRQKIVNCQVLEEIKREKSECVAQVEVGLTLVGGWQECKVMCKDRGKHKWR